MSSQWENMVTACEHYRKLAILINLTKFDILWYGEDVDLYVCL